jgi:single-strand DNA-binding protein
VASPGSDPANPGIQLRRLHHVSEPHLSHRLPRPNASTHTANNASFTVLSLATKSSYKDKKTGEYKGHTEWHRCIVWGRLAEYAKTLTKGAHLSVEGELRSREQTNKKTNAKQRVWEVRVSSILKLDRAEKVAPEEADDSTPDVDQDVPE